MSLLDSLKSFLKGSDDIIKKSDIEKTIFKLFHLSSIFPAKGLEDIKTLVKEGKIEAYLITARYDFLREDLDKWIKKLDLAPYFVKIIHNEKNEQPHLYKERILSELGIEVFVEDNYDIVNHLSKKSPTKVFWLYNIFDRNSDSKEKYSSLKLAVNKIKTLIK